MFEAYSIAVRLKLVDLVSPQLALLAKEFEKLDALTVTLNKSLKAISVDTSGLRILTTAVNATNRAFEKANINATAFEHRMASLSRHTAGVPMLGGGNGGGGSGAHGGNIHIGAAGIGLGTAGFAAGGWFLPLAATGAAAYGGKALYESAKDLNTEQNRFRLLGMTGAQNDTAFDFVKKMKVFGATQAENMAAFLESQGVGRESGLAGNDALRFAMLGAPVLAKLDALGIGLDDDSRSSLHASNLAMLRFVEQSGGLKSPEAFARLANIGFKLKQSSGGTVDEEQLRAMTSTGGAWTQNMTEAGYGHSEPILAEMKGGAYGNAIATMAGRLTGATRPTKAQMTDMLKLGLWDPTMIKLGRGGAFEGFLGNPLGKANTQALMDDFPEFYRTIVRPAYETAHIDGADRVRENTLLLGRQGGKAGNLAEKALPLMDNALLSFNKAMGIDQAGAVLQKSLGGKEAEFTAAWTDFKTDFGTKMLPFFTGILTVGDQILRHFPDVPTAVKTAVKQMPGASALTGLWGLVADNTSTNTYVASQGRMGWKQTPLAVKVDGKTLATITLKHMGPLMAGPQTGTGYFDSLHTPMPAGGM